MTNRVSDSEPVRRPVRPPLQLYEIFVRVAETRSFLATGRLFGVSQPAISQSIARLEDHYPGPLFIRRPGRSLTLTPVGEELLPYAKAMLHAADQSFIMTNAASSVRRGRLSVGFYSGIASGPLREGVISFRNECPEIELALVEGMPGDLHAQFCDRNLDLVIAAFMPEVANAAFEQKSLWSERLVALLPDDHELAERESLGWSDIARLPIILRAAGGDLSGYRAILAAVGPRPLHGRHYAVSRGTLVQMVALGFGIAISFSSAVVPTPGVVAIPIEGDGAVVPVDVLWHAFDENAARLRFLHHLRDAATSWTA
jgi:LysR family hydrogen peroxide-inducible transcriptional activator